MDHEPSNGSDDDRDYEIGTQIARETMTGDVRDLILDEIKNAKRGAKPWQKLSEQEQRTLIDRTARFADDLVARVSRIVAADGRQVINGEIDKLDVKDGKDGALLQARFLTHRSEGALTMLGMAVGQPVAILIQDVQPFRGERAPAEPDPDQPIFDFTAYGPADDGMTVNHGDKFELPPVDEGKSPKYVVSCPLPGRARIAAVQFGAHSLATGQPVEGAVSAQHEDHTDANRVTSVIFTSPEESELTGVDFGLALLNHKGDATANVIVEVNYVRPVEAGAEQDPQPEDGGDTGETFAEEDPRAELDGDTGSQNGHAEEAAQAGEEEDGPTSDLAGDAPPPPAARGIKRARGRRPTTH